MAASHIAAFDATLQKTHEWLHTLAEQAEYGNEAQAYSAMRAVLHALRDRLIVSEAADLGAQLPMLIRGFYYEGWKPGSAPKKLRDREAFLLNVMERLQSANETIDAEHACRSVFSLLNDKITAGEIEDVCGELPHEIRELWPAKGERKAA